MSHWELVWGLNAFVRVSRTQNMFSVVESLFQGEQALAN